MDFLLFIFIYFLLLQYDRIYNSHLLKTNVNTFIDFKLESSYIQTSPPFLIEPIATRSCAIRLLLSLNYAIAYNFSKKYIFN